MPFDVLPPIAPIFVTTTLDVPDVLPLTLEEIFIYELGGEHYEIKDIIL